MTKENLKNRILRVNWMILFSIFFANLIAAQNLEIGNGTVYTCGGIFIDDDGADDPMINSGNNYTNTSYTYTICPDNQESVISVSFTLFNLFATINPNNRDYFHVYDGNSTNSNSLGSYTGTALQGVSITGTVNNSSGCLTFVFDPVEMSPGTLPGWEALISCTTPCTNPTSLFSVLDSELNSENYVGVCPGQPITFQDNGSYSEPGYSIENYIWDFDDGTITEETIPIEVVHLFEEPGEYFVTLIVEDNSGCQTANPEPMRILVSPEPIFNTNFTDKLCLGALGFADGSPIQSQSWSALSPPGMVEETYLPDEQAQPFESTLTIDLFNEGQTLNSCEDLEAITMNIEHSYMGDLLIQITCPSGNTTTLLDNPNLGQGYNLGEPLVPGIGVVDHTEPGVGYNYAWSPNAVNGTMDEWQGPPGTNISLPPGTYESSGPLCDLVGCELNGDWTVSAIDNLSSDDGYIFEWGINFSQETMPFNTVINPEIGMDIDSTYWNSDGAFIIDNSEDGNLIEFSPEISGEYEFTMFAMDNLGCLSDTTITVSVESGPEISLPSLITVFECNESIVNLAPEISSEFNIGPSTFIVTLNNTLDLTGFNNGIVQIFQDGLMVAELSELVAYSEHEIELMSGSNISIEYIGLQPGNQVILEDEFGNLIFESEITPTQGEIFNSVIWAGLAVEWTPSMGLSDPYSLNPTVNYYNLPYNGLYTLSVTSSEFTECEATEDFEVILEPAPDLGDPTTVTYCEFSLEPFEMTGVLSGNPQPVGLWKDVNGNTVDPIFDLTTHTEGSYFYTFQEGICDLSTELDVNINSMHIEMSTDTTICENGFAFLQAEVLGDQNETIEVIWNNGLESGELLTIQPTISPTTYFAQAFYGNNCETEIEEVMVTIHEGLQLTQLTNHLICLEDSLIISNSESITGGLEPYIFNWTPSAHYVTEEFSVLKPSETTEYTLTVEDACESDMIIESFTIELNEAIPATFSGDNLSGCHPNSVDFQSNVIDESLIQSVIWEFGDGTTSNDIITTSHNYTASGLYDVSLTIIGEDGCIYHDANEDFVHIYEVPVANFTAEEFTVTLPNNVFQFENMSSFGESYEWTFDNYGTSYEDNPEFQFPVDVPQEFEVNLTAKSSLGCIDSVQHTVFLVNGLMVYAPNSFTPDGDGLNETWKIEGTDIDEKDFLLTVYNREGTIVFKTNEWTYEWDGSHQNGDYYVPDGIYIYQILVRAKSTGDKHKIMGHITITR